MIVCVAWCAAALIAPSLVTGSEIDAAGDMSALRVLRIRPQAAVPPADPDATAARRRYVELTARRAPTLRLRCGRRESRFESADLLAVAGRCGFGEGWETVVRVRHHILRTDADATGVPVDRHCTGAVVGMTYRRGDDLTAACWAGGDDAGGHCRATVGGRLSLSFGPTRFETTMVWNRPWLDDAVTLAYDGREDMVVAHLVQRLHDDWTLDAWGACRWRHLGPHGLAWRQRAGREDRLGARLSWRFMHADGIFGPHMVPADPFHSGGWERGLFCFVEHEDLTFHRAPGYADLDRRAEITPVVTARTTRVGLRCSEAFHAGLAVTARVAVGADPRRDIAPGRLLVAGAGLRWVPSLHCQLAAGAGYASDDLRAGTATATWNWFFSCQWLW